MNYKSFFILFFIFSSFFGIGIHVDAATQKKPLKKKAVISVVHKKQSLKKNIKKVKTNKKRVRVRKIVEKAAPAGYDTFAFPGNKDYGFAYPIRFNVQLDRSRKNTFTIVDSRTKQSIKVHYEMLPSDIQDEGESAFDEYIQSNYSNSTLKELSSDADKKIGKEFQSKNERTSIFISGPFIIDIHTSHTSSLILSTYKTIIKSFGKI